MGRPILAAYDPQHSDHAPIRFAAAAARFTGARLVIAAVHVGVRAPALSAGQTLPYALAEADDNLVPDASDELREIQAELEADGVWAEVLLPRRVSAAEEGREALRGAYALARRTGARLRVLTVVKPRVVMYTETEAVIPPRPGRDFDRVVGEHRVMAEMGARKAVAQVLGDDGEVEVDAFVGDPGDTLVELSEYLDLLVSGSRGYGPVRAVLLGGVARRLATAGHCPVIVLPRGVEAPLDELLAEAPGTAARAG